MQFNGVKQIAVDCGCKLWSLHCGHQAAKAVTFLADEMY